MLELLKHTLAFYLVIPTIGFAGMYFSYNLKFIQFRKILDAIRSTVNTKHNIKQFSSFGALSAVLGGNLGTGNIAGIAVALSTGGPGSLFWMIIMVLLGSVIKFCCCFLGIIYREKDLDGLWVGGPMYYLSRGLGCKYLDKIFCILLILAAVTTGNFIQINSIMLPLANTNIPPSIMAIIMGSLVGGVMMGGLNRFTQVVTKIVPIMAIFYVLACLIILINFRSSILNSINLIMTQAFNFKAISSAGLASVWIQAMKVGFDRGIMATDTGIGIAPIVHAKVNTDEQLDYRIFAYQQGLISMLAPLVVLLICLLTGLVLLVTGLWNSPLVSTQMCLSAFQIGLGSENLAIFVVNLTLCLFAFTTILTWGYCAENALQYLFQPSYNYRVLFKLCFVLLIPLGVWFEVGFLWNLADVILNLMLLLNMYGVLRLFSQILLDLKKINYSL